jgi:uncharacterized protein YkwD
VSPTIATTGRCCAFLAIALAALACAPAQAAKHCRGANDVPFSQVTDADLDALQCVVNRERDRRELRDLDRTRSLDRAAAQHSSDMARNDYFDHRSPGGSTPAADFGLGIAAGAPEAGVSGGATYTMLMGRRSG